MPRRRGYGPDHARARCRAREATVPGLVVGAEAEAHTVHAAALHNPVGSVRAFLNKAVLPAVRALNGAGAHTLLPTMHRVLNAVRPRRLDPEAAFYGDWMERRTSNQSGRPRWMGATLRLTAKGSATSHHSSAPALLHPLRMRLSIEAARYLNQARATYPGRESGLDGAPHLLHPPDEEVEVGEVTLFVKGADEATLRPRPTNPVYDGTRPTHSYAVVCDAFPQSPTWCPALPPATHAPRNWAHAHLSAPLFRARGANHRLQVLCKSARAPPYSSSLSRPAGTRSGF